MSYSEDRADSRSLTAVVLVLLGVAVVGLVLYFSLWSPTRNGPETVIVQPSVQGPAGAPGETGAQGAPGMTGEPGMPGAQGGQGAAGASGAAGAAGAAGSGTTGETGGG